MNRLHLLNLLRLGTMDCRLVAALPPQNHERLLINLPLKLVRLYRILLRMRRRLMPFRPLRMRP
jgi:hypothetical protein